jgi:signal transduction histidine kinase
VTRGQLTAGLTLATLAIGAAVLAAAVVRISRTALRLEAAEAESRRVAAQEEKARLALWRLDSALTVIIGRESSLPADRFTAAPDTPDSFARRRFEEKPAGPAKPAPPVQAAPVAPPAQTTDSTQSQLNTVEFDQRLRNAASQSSFVPPLVVRQPEPEPSRVETTFQPTWRDGELYLVRRVRQDGNVRLQTLQVDWPALRGSLLAQVHDLLPDADLRPITAGENADPGRRLALLPLRLETGPLPPAEKPSGWSPAQLTVATGSGAIALAGLAVAALLVGSLRQSQRRADFVSAVTHELRTPLTTVRMYTEMLAEGMVPPDGQAAYIATLHGETERLGHLVENVLAYSRLEGQTGKARLETLEIEPLLAGMADRLGERAARDGFTLVLHPMDDPAQVAAVIADAAAVERILFNWVDNACKYAAPATDRRLEIRPLLRGPFAVLQLADHGPGVPPEARRRIFRPFHKSAARAAATAPGVGLGLALSRRLARSQGGDLRLGEETDPQAEGAVFELLLRRG